MQKTEFLDLAQNNDLISFFEGTSEWGREIVKGSHGDIPALWIADPEAKYRTFALNFGSFQWL